MNFIHLEETDSTNSHISRNLAEIPSPTMVTAASQTAGRGQRGNSWESEPGANLTFSMLFRPDHFPARRQFAISEAAALAIADAIAEYGVETKVKWPNDIYAGDRKICGILIENSLTGMELTHTIIGAGINVNQSRFLSDAPNPVSIFQLTGKKTDLVEFRDTVAHHLEKALAGISGEEGRMQTHRLFLQRLWRGDGNLYPFRERAGGGTFLARIADIDPDGPLYLEKEKPGADGSRLKSYFFKEVEFVL